MKITIPTIGNVRSALSKGHTYAGEALLIFPEDLSVYHYLKGHLQWETVEAGWLRAGTGVCLKCVAKETKAITHVYLNTLPLRHKPYWEYFCASAFVHFFGALWDANAKAPFTDALYIYMTTQTQLSNYFWGHYDWQTIVRYTDAEGLLFDSEFPYAARLGTPKAYKVCASVLRDDMAEVVSALGYGHLGITTYSFDFVPDYVRGKELDIASYLSTAPEQRASRDQVHFDLSIFTSPIVSTLFEQWGNDYVLLRS